MYAREVQEQGRSTLFPSQNKPQGSRGTAKFCFEDVTNSQHTALRVEDELVFSQSNCIPGSSINLSVTLKLWYGYKMFPSFHEYFNKRLVRAKLGLLPRHNFN